MTRTPIRCPRCRTPLAEKNRSGPVDVLVDAIKAQRVHEDRTVLVCKVCGEDFVLRFVPPHRKQERLVA